VGVPDEEVVPQPSMRSSTYPTHPARDAGLRGVGVVTAEASRWQRGQRKDERFMNGSRRIGRAAARTGLALRPYTASARSK
jgi:hypothetical protein